MIGKTALVVDRSLRELKADLTRLNTNTRVYVQCSKCREQFIREYSHIHLPHQCNSHTNINNIEYKLCIGCDSYKTHQHFAIDASAYDGVTEYCRSCLNNGPVTTSTSQDAQAAPVRLEVVLDTPLAQVPTRTRTTDAGYDLYASEAAIVEPGGFTKITTDVRISPPRGYYYSIEGRSSLWSKGIVPFRGIIDATFQGPLFVVLQNLSEHQYSIAAGDRVAQLIMHEIIHADFVVVPSFTPVENGRSSNCFGSTGK